MECIQNQTPKVLLLGNPVRWIFVEKNLTQGSLTLSLLGSRRKCMSDVMRIHSSIRFYLTNDYQMPSSPYSMVYICRENEHTVENCS